MAYTPINWQTGDTITAEKMNKMDNGWGIQTTQLFIETVTTTDDGYGYIYAQLDYAQPITAKTITVTFNGVNYVVPRAYRDDMEDVAFYGENNDDGAVFTTYPFLITTASDGYNSLYTETAGTYNVTVTAHNYQLSADFNSAVNSAVTIPDTSTLPLRCESGVTTAFDISGAIEVYGRMAYFVTRRINAPDKIFFITSFRMPIGASPILTFVPEDSSISVSFDSDGVFTVTNA